MHANNEVGTLQPIAEIAHLMHATCSYGKSFNSRHCMDYYSNNY